MFLIIFAVILIAILLLWNYYTTQLYWKRRNVKQLYSLPLLGENWKLFLKLDSFANHLKTLHSKFPKERYYGVYGLFGQRPILAIRDLDLIKQIGVKNFDHFVDHMRLPNLFREHEIWSRNLFVLKGQEWREMRATLSPTFTSSKMKAMFTLMKQSGEQYVSFYKKQKKDLIELEVKDSFTRFTNDVIANCAFGITCDSLNEPDNQFYLNGKEVSNFQGFWRILKILVLITLPKIARVFRMSLFPASLEEYFRALVRDSMQHREEHNIVRPDMINLMIEAKKGLLKYEENSSSSKSTGFATVEESYVGQRETKKIGELTETDMAGQVIIFLLAGFDTVSTMMTFMCYALATNPDVQEKLLNEVDETFEFTQGNLTYDVLAGMKYMDLVTTESLRMYPPIYFVDRQCTRPYLIEPERPEESPIHLKEGDIVWFPIYGLHHDPENFPEPDKFIPERFSEENKADIKPYSFLPFGVGPRNCMGSRFALMEVKILFYHILLEFEIVPVEKTTIPLRIEKGSFNPAIDGGCWVGFKQRKKIRSKID